MSGKSAKKAKKLSVPRELAEIEKESQQMFHSAGQCQYQVEIYTAQLKQFNGRLYALSQEANARHQLNAQSAKPATDAPAKVESNV